MGDWVCTLRRALSGCWVGSSLQGTEKLGDQQGRYCMGPHWRDEGWDLHGPVDGFEQFRKQNQWALLSPSLVQSKDEGGGARLGISQEESAPGLWNPPPPVPRVQGGKKGRRQISEGLSQWRVVGI